MEKTEFLLSDFRSYFQKTKEGHYILPYLIESPCCVMESLQDNGYNSFFESAEIFFPKETNILILVGPISEKMFPYIYDKYKKMAACKWILSIGNCSLSGGSQHMSSSLSDINKLLPIDVSILGCTPPLSEIDNGLKILAKKIIEGKACEIE